MMNMYRKDVNDQSPLRILERSIHGGLGKGNLGVVMARAGVGKTACLVQIGLDDLMRDKDVLHIALGQTLEHVQSWYDALFDDLATRTQLEDRELVRAQVSRHRIIKAYADHKLPVERLEKTIAMLETHMKFKPSALLIDGYEWARVGASAPSSLVAAELGAFKALAKRLGAELWISAQTHRGETGKHPTKLTPPCEAYDDLIDVAIFLEPQGDSVEVRLLKDHGGAPGTRDDAGSSHLHLHSDTLRLVPDGEEPAARPRLPASSFTLLSGGADGAEAEFGRCAEQLAMTEINFSFEGRGVERTRGLVQLSEVELRQGAVSSAYLTAHMHRTYKDTPLFRKILSSIWHQVNSAGEVFVVGVIQSDGTVKGGTGWAAELARHFEKPLHVYDQEKKGWFAWTRGEWTPVKEPVITRTRFAGTGTRFLSDDGRAAIRALFERSF
jgi:hypothetical protein